VAAGRVDLADYAQIARRLREGGSGSLQALYELRLAEAKAGKAIKKLPTLKRLEGAHA
jgi:hypothetical protein